MQDFRKLKVWSKAQDFTVQIYSSTEQFPGSEKFGLSAQLRNACTSIGSNIAEGCGRGSKKDFVRYLNIALGSAFEAESQILLAQRLGYLNESNTSYLIDGIVEIKRMLYSLIRQVKASASAK